jgi:hypothetical protein
MKLLLLLFLFPVRLLSQDISGVWTGHIETLGNELPYEIVVSISNDRISGYSLMTFTMNGYENSGIKSIKLKNKSGSVFIEDDELIYNNYSTPPKRVKLVSSLSLAVKDSVMTLSGNFKTRAVDFRTSDNLSYSGTIELVKQTNTAQTKLMSMLEKLNLAGALSFVQPKITTNETPATQTVLREETDSSVAIKREIVAGVSQTKKSSGNIELGQINSNTGKTLAFPVTNMDSLVNATIIVAASERKTDIVRSVFFKADSLVLSLYDNGIVDGDTVSVVMNGKVILANQGLTTRAIRYVIHVTPDIGDSILLTMVAENLGSIPPNTGLLIVEDGEQRNEIRFTGDMQMSSAVLFRRKH